MTEARPPMEDAAPGGRAPTRRLLAVQYLAVLRKEVRQTLRDRRVIFLLVAAPLVQLVVFGFAVNFDVDDLPAAVADLDRSAASREHLRRVLADGTLRAAVEARSAEEADRLLDEDRAALALVVPPRFGEDLQAGRPARAQALVNGADPVRATAAASAATRFFAEAAAERAAARLRAAGLRAPTVVLAPRVLYNPRLRTSLYIVPGIMAMLLVVVTTVVTAMGLAREREQGTLEQVLVTPVRPVVLLAGKMTPFVVIGLLDVLLALTAMTWIFGVPVRGPLAVLALGSLLYLCSTLGMGLFISTVSSTQQQSFLGGLLFILPAALLSGIMTPIRAMPPWLRAATWANPLRFFGEVVRGVLLRGAGLAELWAQLAMLLVFGAGILALAAARFRKRLG